MVAHKKYRLVLLPVGKFELSSYEFQFETFKSFNYEIHLEALTEVSSECQARRVAVLGYNL